MTPSYFSVDRESGNEFAALLENGGRLLLKVTGNSMLPLLSPRRSTVLIVGCTGADVRIGDILLFRRTGSDGVEGRFVLHRLRRILSDGRLLMNGDAQNWCEVIDRSAVAARVEEIRSGKRIYSCDGFLMRLYRFVWYPTYRFRPILLKLLLFLRKEFSR